MRTMNVKKETKTKLSVATAVLVFIGAAFGLFTQIDSRVESKITTQVEAVRSEIKDDQMELEEDVVQSLEQFQQQQQQLIEQQDLRYWNLKIDALIEQKDRIQEDLMVDPSNEYLKRKLEKLDEKIDYAKEKLNQLLEGDIGG